MEDINSHAMLNELLKRSDEKDPGGFPVCLYHYIGESVKLYLRHDAVIKHINLKQCEHKQLNEVSECIKCGQVITVIKQVSTPHPSDSDIESKDNLLLYATDLARTLHKDYYSHVVNWEPLETLYGVLSQIDNMICGINNIMRDRMNGEMCLFVEWREENYTKTKKGYYHKGDFYKNDKPLTTEQLLQKFRNRDL